MSFNKPADKESRPKIHEIVRQQGMDDQQLRGDGMSKFQDSGVEWFWEGFGKGFVHRTALQKSHPRGRTTLPLGTRILLLVIAIGQGFQESHDIGNLGHWEYP